MLQRTADAPTAARKRGVCESDYAALNMGLFVMNAVLGAVSSASADGVIAENKLQCVGANNQTYTCDSGHCCGESQCCSYYYELWWFWLVWTVIIILSCCCVCHHRRAKHRLQQQQRQHEINLIAYREVNNYSSLPFYLRFLPSYLLPAYEEVENRPPTPPPPYSPAQAGQGSDAPSPEQPDHLHRPSLQSGPTPPCDSAESDPTGGCLEEPRHPNPHFPGTAVRTVTTTGRKPYLSFAPDVPQSQVACATSPESTKRGVCCKENPKSEEQAPDCCPDAKDKTPGRHRRFTGDSGIEVCVCNRGPGEEEDDEMKEYEGLLDGEGLQEQDFCDSCNPHHAGADPQQRSGDEEEPEQGFVGPEQDPEHRDTPPNLRPPICLHLHTINETEAPHHGNNTEPPI